ncbi:hypothetical protein L226DRAFT_532557 [Lentinus tigrinus ALCF2SS1-7]|uniref:Uncharacterized protein n=1 Tax=Lentinus tigrinus ALCF2SS1-6 TaxID=1328759 RepID=A0A5C2SLU1_9APHY|nr:hypothetical protein L227DRAFT_36207 [Lentinus tigrinus ALCF2SS1-6]RPD77789.1 hypothetical protein L226DRAFT_532557 [Lentinus tigrinus ALCF2SS1-7]
MSLHEPSLAALLPWPGLVLSCWLQRRHPELDFVLLSRFVLPSRTAHPSASHPSQASSLPRILLRTRTPLQRCRSFDPHAQPLVPSKYTTPDPSCGRLPRSRLPQVRLRMSWGAAVSSAAISGTSSPSAFRAVTHDQVTIECPTASAPGLRTSRQDPSVQR